MKSLAGFLVVAALLLTGCEPAQNDAQLQESEAPASETVGQQESALGAGDCTVSLTCASGVTASCSGTNRQCSIDPNGLELVWCNGNSYGCRFVPAPCGCARDNCCSEVCALDPDCGSCTPGRSCTSDSQCGGTLSGRCNAITKKCSCIIGVDAEREN
ncbi:hypothetical protein MFUL124B02_13610 [Myxococcus fulvus 124B02]|nr:hypothetical protein MFUL124B02_13610 [Myxococcus fulvus 124B02]